MLYREIIDVCSKIHTQYINTLCGRNVEFMNVKLAVRILSYNNNQLDALFNFNLFQ